MNRASDEPIVPRRRINATDNVCAKIPDAGQRIEPDTSPTRRAVAAAPPATDLPSTLSESKPALADKPEMKTTSELNTTPAQATPKEARPAEPRFDGALLAERTRLPDHKIPPPPRMPQHATQQHPTRTQSAADVKRVRAATQPVTRPGTTADAGKHQQPKARATSPGLGWRKPLIVLAMAVLAMALLVVALKLGGIGGSSTDSDSWDVGPPPVWQQETPTVELPKMDTPERDAVPSPQSTETAAEGLYPTTQDHAVAQDHATAPSQAVETDDSLTPLNQEERSGETDTEVPGVARLQGIIQKTTLEANHDGSRSRLH